MDIVNTSFDALIVNVKGRAPRWVLDTLESAQLAAKGSGAPEYVEIGGVRGHVRSTGTAGGYRYQLDTGPMGEVILLKRSDDPMQWNIRFEIRALNLKAEGYHAIRDNIKAIMKTWRCDVHEYGIARADFAIDVACEDGHALDPEMFVMPSRSESNEHYLDDPLADPERQTRRRCRRVTSVTIGAKGRRQLQVYDKREEQKKRQKTEWYEAWGFTKDDCPQVWRIELRLFNDHLKDWNIRTFEDFEAGIGDALRAAMIDIRYCEEIDVHNASRSTVHPLWVIAFDALDTCMVEMRDGRLRGRIIKCKSDDAIKQLTGQIAGCAATFAFIRTLFDHVPDIDKMVVDDVTDMVRARMKTPEWREAQVRAEQRLHFLDAEGAS